MDSSPVPRRYCGTVYIVYTYNIHYLSIEYQKHNQHAVEKTRLFTIFAKCVSYILHTKTYHVLRNDNRIVHDEFEIVVEQCQKTQQRLRIIVINLYIFKTVDYAKRLVLYGEIKHKIQ